MHVSLSQGTWLRTFYPVPGLLPRWMVSCLIPWGWITRAILSVCFVPELNISRFHNDGLVSLFMSWQTSDISCLECVAITTMQLRFFQVNTQTCYSHYTSSSSGGVRIINIVIPRIIWTLNPKRCGKPLVMVSTFIHKSQYLRNLSDSVLQFVNLTSYVKLIYV